ncbi:MAG: PAS domain-containing sensor histidine kinase [Bacteroidales bacterium]
MKLFRQIAQKISLSNTEVDSNTINYQNKKITYNLADTQKAKKFLTVVLQSTMDAIIFVNAQREIIDFNDAAEFLFHYKAEEVIGQPIDNLILKSKVDFYNRKIEQAMEAHTGGSQLTLQNEKIFKKKNNTSFSSDIFISCFQDTEETYTILIIKDLSKIKEKDQELVKSKERLELALESAKIGLWDQNFRTGEVYRSKQWAQMLGYTLEEIGQKAKDWISLIHPEDLSKVKAATHEHETGRTDAFNVEHRLKTKNGDYKWILNWGKIVEFDKDGNPLRALGSHIDIHNRKETEEKLKYLNETKNRLFSIIGHDLKNPLSDIIGFSELLCINYDKYPPEKVKKFHELIFSSAKTTQNLLDNLLQWSRFHSGELLFKPENFNLEHVVNNNFILFKSKAESKKIDLQNEIKEPVEVYADKKMIETVLRNLISNAIKYTREGGKITLRHETKDDKAVLAVEDTGIGIKDKDINKLFLKGQQISTEGTTGEQGTGLGLIICQDFINKHNESIWVTSQPGKGTTFRFTLPQK